MFELVASNCGSLACLDMDENMKTTQRHKASEQKLLHSHSYISHGARKSPTESKKREREQQQRRRRPRAEEGRNRFVWPVAKYHLTFVGITNLCIYTIYFSRRSTAPALRCRCVCTVHGVIVACNGQCFYTKTYIYTASRVFPYVFIFGSRFSFHSGRMDGWFGWRLIKWSWVGFWLMCVW